MGKTICGKTIFFSTNDSEQWYIVVPGLSVCVCMCVFMYLSWRREWKPTPVFLSGGCHGQRSLVCLKSMGSQRVRHDWATSTFTSCIYVSFICLFFHLPIEREWHRDKETQWETKLYLYVSPHIIVNYLRGIIDLHIKVQIMSFQKKTLNENILSSWRRKWQPTPVFLPGES